VGERLEPSAPPPTHTHARTHAHARARTHTHTVIVYSKQVSQAGLETGLTINVQRQLTYLLHGAEFFLRTGYWLIGSAASQEIPPHFMEPKNSLPYSQVPATCPYPEPTPSSPHNPIPLPVKISITVDTGLLHWLPFPNSHFHLLITL
jgi:hypothetical protein